ncbi:MAG TPA: patatin-like phospholipase family protein, partial [Gammaproteobacteria bacterium]|nr:patatin-like phospholipase family protein [Gammaproteobacteria bacterium]
MDKTKLSYDFAHFSRSRSSSLRPINVLVTSGGGSLGILPLAALQYIEKKTGEKLSDSIDLFVGTSTGAIINTALDSKVKILNGDTHDASFVMDSYLKMIPNVFKTSVWYRLKTLDGFLGPAYLHEPLAKSLISTFGQEKLSNMKKPLVFISFDMSQEKILRFRSWRLNTYYSEVPVYQLLLGATSAPTKFSPYVIKFPGQKTRSVLIDGGMIANTPEILAYLEARKLFPNRDIRIIALGDGTGRDILAPNLNTLTSLGILAWAKQLATVFIHGHALLNKMYLRDIVALPHSRLVSFYWLNVSLPLKDRNEFDSSKAYLLKLQRYGKQFVNHEKKHLDDIALTLSPTRT